LDKVAAKAWLGLDRENSAGFFWPRKAAHKVGARSSHGHCRAGASPCSTRGYGSSNPQGCASGPMRFFTLGARRIVHQAASAKSIWTSASGIRLRNKAVIAKSDRSQQPGSPFASAWIKL